MAVSTKMAVVQQDILTPSVHYSTEVIKQNVQQQIYTLFQKQNMRSIVWQSFRGILDELGNEIFGICCCSQCYTCIRYKVVKNGIIKDFGTKNLRDHLLYCGVPRIKRKKEKLLSQEIREIATDYKLGCPPIITANAVINQMVDSDGRRIEGVGKEGAICKVECLDDELLDEINTQVNQIDSEMASEMVSGVVPHPTTPQTSKDDSVTPSGNAMKRIQVFSLQAPPPSSSSHAPPEVSFVPSSPTPTKGSSYDLLKEDEHDLFGRHVANELRSLPGNENRRWARFQIQKVLFEAHSCSST